MISLTASAASGLWLAACTGLFALQAHQASRFLHAYGGPPLTRWHVVPVALIYLLTAVGLLTSSSFLPDATIVRSLALLVLAVPLTLTDLRCQWLPMRYTVLFWLGGLVSASVAETTQPLISAGTNSVLAFCVSGAVRWIINGRHHEERIGLGDVYLMAGLCAWLPWRSACYAAAGGLLLCCLCAAVTRQPSKPFAPALFGYLCGVCLLFPQQLVGVL